MLILRHGLLSHIHTLLQRQNPVGVGQTVAVVMWVDDALPGATVTNDVRRHDYSLAITSPDGQTQTQNWPVVSDSTSVQYYQFTPDQVGIYTLKFNYPKQIYTWSGEYQNDTFTAASKTITLTVQQDPIPAAKDSYPLPTEYWTRPIEGENTYWYTIRIKLVRHTICHRCRIKLWSPRGSTT